MRRVSKGAWHVVLALCLVCVLAPTRALAKAPVFDYSGWLNARYHAVVNEAQKLQADVKERELEKRAKAESEELTDADMSVNRAPEIETSKQLMESAKRGPLGFDEAGMDARARRVWGPEAEPFLATTVAELAVFHDAVAQAIVVEDMEVARQAHLDLLGRTSQASNHFQGTKASGSLLALTLAQESSTTLSQAFASRAEFAAFMEARSQGVDSVRGRRMLSTLDTSDALAAPTSPALTGAQDSLGLPQPDTSMARARLVDPAKLAHANRMFARVANELNAGLGRSLRATSQIAVLLSIIMLVWLGLRAQLTGELNPSELISRLVMIGLVMAFVASWPEIAGGIRAYIVSDMGVLGAGGDLASNPAGIMKVGGRALSSMLSPTGPTGALWRGSFTGQTLVTLSIALLLTFLSLLAATYVALTAMIVHIEFKVTVLISVLFVPFALNKHTSSISESAFHAVVGSSVKMATLSLLLGLMGPAILELEHGAQVDIGQLLSHLFALSVVAYALTRVPMIASVAFMGAGEGTDASAPVRQLKDKATSYATGGASKAGKGLAQGAQAGAKNIASRLTGSSQGGNS